MARFYLQSPLILDRQLALRRQVLLQPVLPPAQGLSTTLQKPEGPRGEGPHRHRSEEQQLHIKYRQKSQDPLHQGFKGRRNLVGGSGGVVAEWRSVPNVVGMLNKRYIFTCLHMYVRIALLSTYTFTH